MAAARSSVELLAQFLVSRGYINPSQLMLAMEEQERCARPIGQYAVAFGYMTAEQAERAHQHQLVNRLKFGEAAIELGLLSKEQLNSALTAQRNEHISLGDALVNAKILDSEEFQKATLEFMEDQVRFAELAMQVPAEAPHRAALMRIYELVSTMLLRVWGIRSSPGEVRLAPDPAPLLDYSASLEISGDLEALFLISVPTACVLRGSEKVLGTDDVLEEERADLVREFVNVVAGHTVGALAISGTHVAISTPESITEPLPLRGRLAVVGPSLTAHGPVETTVLLKPAEE